MEKEDDALERYRDRRRETGLSMEIDRKNKRIGFMLAVWTGILWGASSPVAQYLFESKGLESSWLTPYRLLASGILLFAFSAVRKQDVWGVWKEKPAALRLIVFGIAGMMGKIGRAHV